MLKKFKITCDEATTICDKNQYGEATFMEKLKLQLHFLKCAICQQYTKQNILLTKIYKKKAKSDQVATARFCMSDEEKEKLRKEMEKLSA
jgi:hypothetical protein